MILFSDRFFLISTHIRIGAMFSVYLLTVLSVQKRGSANVWYYVLSCTHMIYLLLLSSDDLNSNTQCNTTLKCDRITINRVSNHRTLCTMFLLLLLLFI